MHGNKDCCRWSGGTTYGWRPTAAWHIMDQWILEQQIMYLDRTSDFNKNKRSVLLLDYTIVTHHNSVFIHYTHN